MKHTFPVYHHGRVEDRGIRRQRRRALQDLRERQLVEPDERQPVLEPLELPDHCLAPVLLRRGVAGHDEDRGGVGEKHQDVVDRARHVRYDGNSRQVDAGARVTHETRIPGGLDDRRRRKQPLPVLFNERRCRAAHRHHQVELPDRCCRGLDVVHDGLFMSRHAERRSPD